MGKTAERIIAKYGDNAFRRLIDDLHAGICLSKIAESMGVTRQCVSQWKKLLGYPSTRWEPHPFTGRYSGLWDSLL